MVGRRAAAADDAGLAYGAGRFTHGVFPENVHRPALDTELLLAGPGRNWASRVFFSDDGAPSISLTVPQPFSSIGRHRRTVLIMLNACIDPNAY
jgi:dethiobiotin synthetase/adenosylmethionine--8-amino-7-oxononanoate aminotransferase